MASNRSRSIISAAVATSVAPAPEVGEKGYEDATLRTAEGGIGVKVPQVRDAEVPYRSKLIEFLAGGTEALDRPVVEMYARGLSTRDIEDAFRGPDRSY